MDIGHVAPAALIFRNGSVECDAGITGLFYIGHVAFRVGAVALRVR
jgi:hypothetical protein